MKTNFFKRMTSSIVIILLTSQLFLHPSTNASLMQVEDPNFVENSDLSKFGVFSNLLPENSFAIQIRNSEGMIDFSKTLRSGIIEMTKNIPDMDAGDLQKVISESETIIDEYFNTFKHAMLYVRFKDGITAENYETIKTLIADEDEEAMIAFAQENLCVFIDVQINHEDFKNEILSEAEQAKVMLPNFVKLAVQKDQGRIMTQLFDCQDDDRAAVSKVRAQPVNLLMSNHGLNQDFAKLMEYSIDEARSAASDDEIAFMDELIEIFTDINYTQVVKETTKNSFALNFTKNGFMKVQHYTIKDPELLNMQKRFLQGKAMARPLYLGKNNNFSYSTQMSGDDLYHLERYENLDPSFLAGSYLSLYSGMGMNGIVVIGILATVSVATFDGYFEKAKEAERIASVRNSSTVLKTAFATSDIQDYALTKNEVENTLLSMGGFNLPDIREDGFCFQFAYDLNNTNEFVIYSTDGLVPEKSDGTQQATNEFKTFYDVPECGEAPTERTVGGNTYNIINL